MICVPIPEGSLYPGIDQTGDKGVWEIPSVAALLKGLKSDHQLGDLVPATMNSTAVSGPVPYRNITNNSHWKVPLSPHLVETPNKLLDLCNNSVDCLNQMIHSVLNEAKHSKQDNLVPNINVKDKEECKETFKIAGVDVNVEGDYNISPTDVELGINMKIASNAGEGPKATVVTSQSPTPSLELTGQSKPTVITVPSPSVPHSPATSSLTNSPAPPLTNPTAQPPNNPPTIPPTNPPAQPPNNPPTIPPTNPAVPPSTNP